MAAYLKIKEEAGKLLKEESLKSDNELTTDKYADEEQVNEKQADEEQADEKQADKEQADKEQADEEQADKEENEAETLTAGLLKCLPYITESQDINVVSQSISTEAGYIIANLDAGMMSQPISMRAILTKLILRELTVTDYSSVIKKYRQGFNISFSVHVIRFFKENAAEVKAELIASIKAESKEIGYLVS